MHIIEKEFPCEKKTCPFNKIQIDYRKIQTVKFLHCNVSTTGGQPAEQKI